MSKIECQLIEKTEFERLFLRRYVPIGEGDRCPENLSYHNAMAFLEDAEYEKIKDQVNGDFWSHADPLWPKECEYGCGYKFKESDYWQLFSRTLYRKQNNSLVTLEDVEFGAMWFADWLSDTWKGNDGRCLVVKTPGGEWAIDSVASNCGKRGDKNHNCWIREGVPPKITVSKSGCNGSYSIQIGNGQNTYHGFLTNGFLVSA